MVQYVVHPKSDISAYKFVQFWPSELRTSLDLGWKLNLGEIMRVLAQEFPNVPHSNFDFYISNDLFHAKESETSREAPH